MEWISTEDRLPKKSEEAQHLLLWIVHKENPLWEKAVQGSFENKKFYANNGIDYTYEKVTHWKHLTPPNELKEQ